MDLNIRNIEKEDIGSVLELLREFAEYENLSEYCTATEERFTSAMFGDGAVVDGLIATDAAKPIGYALFYPNFSSFRSQPGMYLEDIYVTSGYRSTGAGKALLKEVARAAAARGCERIDMLVLDWNTPATRFYEALGAVRDPDERHYKFTDEAFKNLAN